MPLEKGPPGSPEFRHNIEAERGAGKPEAQAVAIAYRQAGEKRADVDAYHDSIRRGDADAMKHFRK
jgi:hypothetical protein